MPKAGLLGARKTGHFRVRLYPPGAEEGERWELEADPRHVEILVSQMGLGGEMSSLGVRMTDEDGRQRV